MSTEDLPSHEHKDTTEECSFDELARGMAEGAISRGRVLKLVGAAILGSALSIFALPGKAHARHRYHRRRRRGPTCFLNVGDDCTAACPGLYCTACCTGLCSRDTTNQVCCLPSGAPCPGTVCTTECLLLCCSEGCKIDNGIGVCQ
jgi:hypothetical protein